MPDNKDRIPLRLSVSDLDNDLDENLTFTHYAASNFRGNVTYQFSKRPLKQSLLDLPLPADQVVSDELHIACIYFNFTEKNNVPLQVIIKYEWTPLEALNWTGY